MRYVSHYQKMNVKRLLASKGVHYLVTRFGPRGLRSMAFDEKYLRGDWNFRNDVPGELPQVVRRYLRQGDLLVMGCGGAAIFESLKPTELTSAQGIDLSEAAIRLASRFACDRISFLTSDMESFECRKSYDVILFSESLYYIGANRQIPLLTRLAKSLKPGGAFIVTFAQAKRYEDILARIRLAYPVLEDRTFVGLSRHLIVFQPRQQSQ